MPEPQAFTSDEIRAAFAAGYDIEREIHGGGRGAVAGDFEKFVEVDGGREGFVFHFLGFHFGREDDDEQAAFVHVANQGLVAGAGDPE